MLFLLLLKPDLSITPSTLGLLPGISVYTGTKCRAKLRYYNLARSILVLQFEVDQALHLARANLAPHFTYRVDATKRNIPGYI